MKICGKSRRNQGGGGAIETDCLIRCVLFGLLVVGGCGRTQMGEVEQEKASGGTQRAHRLDKTISKKVTCDYLLYLPVGYGEKEQAWLAAFAGLPESA
jgi:hypothetical protein